ncbi:MAG: outer membrane beta-barrel protein, partial [Xanthobacteraceae bacterium]
MNRWLLACVVLGGFAGCADAADMAVLGPYQPPPIAPLYSWTGCYIGVNMGGGAAPKSSVDTLGNFAPPGTSLGDMTARGVAGGGQLGCDYQVGSWVFGVGGLLDLSGMKGSDVLPTTILVNNSFVQTFATVTGRVGYTVLPNLLIYGKGGGAFVHDLYNIATPTGQAVPFFAGTMTVAPSTAVFNPSSVPTLVFDNNGNASIANVLTPGGRAALVPPGTIVALASKSTTGWTAGFGAEWAFPHAPVSLSLEYSYMHFGSTQVPFLSAIVPGLVFPI